MGLPPSDTGAAHDTVALLTEENAAVIVTFTGGPGNGASVVVRGYPDKADSIRSQMRLKENAEHYLLATVWGETERGFIAARRVGA